MTRSSDLGRAGEDLVAEYYIRQGYQILERNFVPPTGKQIGELDLIVRKDQQIVFVEVKTRTSMKFGGPFEAVTRGKQVRLVRAAKFYLKFNPKYEGLEARIDVAAVDIDNPASPVIIIPNAIEDFD